jgi:hypothetical protein
MSQNRPDSKGKVVLTPDYTLSRYQNYLSLIQ